SLPGHAVPVWGLAFSPDGRKLASAARGVAEGGTPLPGELKIWDAADGRELLRLPGRGELLDSVAFNPDGRQLAFADGRTVRVCDPATGQEVRAPLQLSSLVNSVAYSADGQRLAAGGTGGDVRVWNVATGQESLVVHQAGVVMSVAFSPGGRR